MTAAFDVSPGTGHRFVDALSGSDGTADPSVLLPVLDIYPDALSATMPVDVVPVVVPPIALPTSQAGIRADPALGPATRSPGGRPPAAARGAQSHPMPRQSPRQSPQQSPRQTPQRTPQRAGALPAGPRPVAPGQPVAFRQPPQVPVRSGRAPIAFSYQGTAFTAGDIAAVFRGMRPGRPTQVDRQSFQATHPQSMGSVSPDAVAPAAPMASQYTARGEVRNDARNRAQERRRSSSTMKQRSSSAWGVIVFFVVIAFASGGAQKAIELFNELFNR